MKITLRPLSELTFDGYHRRVLMVRKDLDGRVYSAYLGSLAGAHAMRDWCPDAVPMPDGWCEPIEIDENGHADNT